MPLTPRLQQLLLSRRANDFRPDDPIFTSTNGCAMAYRPASYDAKNFCNRYWKPALAELGIDYRRPYNTRHTLISHGLEAGMNPVAIAASPATMSAPSTKTMPDSSTRPGGVTTRLKPRRSKDLANPLLKKDRQPNCYTRFLSKK